MYIYHQQLLKTEMKAFLKENHSSGFGSKLVFSLNSGKIDDVNDVCSKQSIAMTGTIGNNTILNTGDENDYDPFA